MRETPPTDDETSFFQELLSTFPDLQDWYHADADGTPWMTVSYDIVESPGQGVVRTWRLDYDKVELVGGLSPAALNWDDGVRGRDTRMDLKPPNGLVAPAEPLEAAVAVAVSWLAGRIDS